MTVASRPGAFRQGQRDMFRGANKVTLDAKGRLAMPTRYRERIVERSNGRLIATVDRADRCLLIYPLPEWEEIELKLRRLPTLNPVARRLQRLMIGHATDLELDGSGRILVPPSLREYAGLSRTAMLIGQGQSLRAVGRGAVERQPRAVAEGGRDRRRAAAGTRVAVAVVTCVRACCSTRRCFSKKCWPRWRFAPAVAISMRRSAAAATRRRFWSE